jgi:hypothetical protein
LFDSVRFLFIKIIKLNIYKIQKIKSKLNKNRFQPTDFDLVRLFYIKNQNPINRFRFGLISVWFDYFILKTKNYTIFGLFFGLSDMGLISVRFGFSVQFGLVLTKPVWFG